MNLKRCENGHFYDADKFDNCPHCATIGGESDRTVAYAKTSPNEMDTEPVTAPKQMEDTDNISLKEAVEVSMSREQQDDDSVTVSYYGNKIGIEPVVGWLVCIEGVYFGESFKLKAGRNFIGRASNMDIALKGDQSVSRDKHAILLYEPRKREFIAQAGDSRELFYLNDNVVLNTEKLKLHDVLTIGKTKLMFFPCCSAEFSWDDFQQESEK